MGGLCSWRLRTRNLGSELCEFEELFLKEGLWAGCGIHHKEGESSDRVLRERRPGLLHLGSCPPLSSEPGLSCGVQGWRNMCSVLT